MAKRVDTNVLRAQGDALAANGYARGWLIVKEAADEIDRLRAFVNTARAMLEDGHPCSGADGAADEWWAVMQDALRRLENG